MNLSFLTRLFGVAEEIAIPYPRHSLEGLAARWVQWGASTNFERSPIADSTGEYAHLNQPKDVWFLAGCFGGRVSRTCIIPPNKKLFLPIFNMWVEDGIQASDLHNAFGNLKVDGKQLQLDTIFVKKPFIVKGVFGNPVTESVFGCKLYVGGLWKLLDPLEAGSHEIFLSGGDGYGFNLEVIYNISVTSQQNIQ